MYAAVRSEMTLSKRIAALAHQLSDANLAAMPEFHQRIAVLRQLECEPLSVPLVYDLDNWNTCFPS